MITKITAAILFVGCAATLGCSMAADRGGFEQHYHGPTTVIHKEGSVAQDSKCVNGAVPADIGNKEDAAVGKSPPTATAQESLSVHTDLALIEEFVKRGLVQKIRDGSLSHPGSCAFLELKSSLTLKP